MSDQTSQTPDQQPVSRTQRSQYIWLLVGIAAAVAVLCLEGPGSFLQGAAHDLTANDLPQAEGRLLGVAMFNAGLGTAVLYFFLRNTRFRGHSWRHFGLLLVVGVVTNGLVLLYLSNLADAAQYRLAEAEARKAIGQTIDVGPKDINVNIETTGRAGELETIAKNVVREIANIEGPFAQQLADLDYPGFMSLSKLAADKGASQASSTLAHISVLERGRTTARLAIDKKYRAKIAASSLSDDRKKDLLTGMDIISTPAAIVRDSEEEQAAISEYVAMIDDLAHLKGTLIGQDGDNYRFSSADDAAKFGSHATRLRELRHRQQDEFSKDQSAMRVWQKTSLQ